MVNTTQQVSRNESHQHRVLVVGVGSIGQRHIRCLRETGRAEVAICEVNDALRRDEASKYGIEETYSDLKSSLAGSFDAAVIATPAHLHVSMALLLVNAGVHLLIEKPLGTSMDQVALLQKTVRRSGVVAAVGYNYRGFAALAAMRTAIAAGHIGRPLEIVVQSGADFARDRPGYEKTYFRDHATGGGAIQDAVTHLFNAVQWIVGPADTVIADTAHQTLPHVTVEDTAHVMARYGDVLASYSVNQYQPHDETTIQIIGDAGAARFSFEANHWQWFDPTQQDWRTESFGPLRTDDTYVHQAHRFFDAIEHRGEPLCSLDEAVVTLGMNLATLQSVRERRWVRLAEVGVVKSPAPLLVK